MYSIMSNRTIYGSTRVRVGGQWTVLVVAACQLSVVSGHQQSINSHDLFLTLECFYAVLCTLLNCTTIVLRMRLIP